jgi:hypothetical protein
MTQCYTYSEDGSRMFLGTIVNYLREYTLLYLRRPQFNLLLSRDSNREELYFGSREAVKPGGDTYWLHFQGGTASRANK